MPVDLLNRVREDGIADFHVGFPIDTRHARVNRVGYANPSSCCAGVFVDQSAESVASLDQSWLVGSDGM